jgi:hypothetical protein
MQFQLEPLRQSLSQLCRMAGRKKCAVLPKSGDTARVEETVL